jgi:general stress protein 26
MFVYKTIDKRYVNIGSDEYICINDISRAKIEPIWYVEDYNITKDEPDAFVIRFTMQSGDTYSSDTINTYQECEDTLFMIMGWVKT